MKNKEERDNRIVIIVIFVLLVTMVTLILVSGAYARYTSKAAGSDVATVAKWSFKVNGTEIGGVAEKEVQFDIFSTLMGQEDNIYKTDGSLIAPGTKGSFNIQLTNESEVNAEYKVSYTMENSSAIPLEFSYDQQKWDRSIETALNMDSYTPINKDQTLTTKTIYWRWAFEGDATTDTKLGVSAAGSGAPKCTIKAVVEAQQVD